MNLRLLRPALAGFTIFLAVSASGDDMTRDQALAAGKAAGDAGQAAANQAGTNIDPSSFPGYQGSDVPERNYYSSGGGIEDQARQKLPEHQLGSELQRSAQSRPRFSFRSDDGQPGSILKREDAAATAGSALTASYSGCQSLSSDNQAPSHEEASCSADALDLNPTCNRKRVARCQPPVGDLAMDFASASTNAPWSYQKPELTIGDQNRVNGPSGCAILTYTFSFDIAGQGEVEQFVLFATGMESWMEVQVNGVGAYYGPYGGNVLRIENGGVRYDTTKGLGACRDGWRTQSTNVNLKPYLRAGRNTITVNILAGNAGGYGRHRGYVKIRATRYSDCSDDSLDTYSSSCSQDVSGTDCKLQSTVCVEGAETRIVEGRRAYRGCWAYKETYLCTNRTKEASGCSQLRNRGCEQIRSTCVRSDAQGRCQQYRQDFKCPAGNPGQSSATICGNELYCPGGNCTEEYKAYQPSGDLAQSATYLSMMQNLQDDFDPSNFTMFKGESRRCSEAQFGFSNCCKDSGWGQDVGLAQCDTTEIELGQAKQNGRTHYVGSHTTGGPFDEKKWKTYCMFSSKLTRIIQQQGRLQMGMGWGSSKSPDCRALTPDEVSNLDWERMDLSEFYADAQAQAQSAMQDREGNSSIESRLRTRVNSMGSSGSSTNPSSGQ